MSKITLPPNKDSFIFFSPSINTFYSLSFLVIGKYFNVILNRNGESAYPCLVPHIKRNMFNVSSLAMMFSLDNSYQIEGTSLVAQRVKNLPVMRETGFDPWVGKISWRRQGQPTPVFLPGESHGWRSLVGCSPWGHKESDTTEQLHFTCGSLQAQGSHFGRYLAVQQQGPTPPYNV